MKGADGWSFFGAAFVAQAFGSDLLNPCLALVETDLQGPKLLKTWLYIVVLRKQPEAVGPLVSSAAYFGTSKYC